MFTDEEMKDLVTDMRSWGVPRVRRIMELAKKHGILMSTNQYSDGHQG